jgi:hypothetical protein
VCVRACVRVCKHVCDARSRERVNSIVQVIKTSECRNLEVCVCVYVYAWVCMCVCVCVRTRACASMCGMHVRSPRRVKRAAAPALFRIL